jgi:hypothetical protein
MVPCNNEEARAVGIPLSLSGREEGPLLDFSLRIDQNLKNSPGRCILLMSSLFCFFEQNLARLELNENVRPYVCDP